ncbi:hypothetical protein DCCM_0631 [Desulfocucumis palustris]|uniref:Uncharacterized protein n=1 Tax=Desulfocucumis palustris TaxID=1898651 RepID=A0A2L2X8D9_9FIRM|nr:hypothetical protein DCCM_0631 [Desulfocucumis palustris]
MEVTKKPPDMGNNFYFFIYYVLICRTAPVIAYLKLTFEEAVKNKFQSS